MLEWQVAEDLRGARPHRGHDLEPGREAVRMRGQEGGEGVAVVRAVMLRLPGVNILQINRLFEQKIALKNEKFGNYVPFHELP